MNYKVLTLSQRVEWSSYLKKLPLNQQDIYYTPEYYTLYENNGDGEANCFVFEDEGQLALYPFLLNSVNALGYELDDEYFDIQGAYGYNGVVSSTYDTEFKTNFYKAFDEYCGIKKIIAEFTRFNPVLKNHHFSEGFLETIAVMDNIVMNLNDDNFLYNSYQHSTRKNINTAKRNNLYVKHFFDKEINDYEIEAFKNIYKESMLRNNAEKYYFFNDAFFKSLFKTLNDRFMLSFSYINNIEVATEIVLLGQETAYSFLGGTFKEYFKYRANDLLKHEIIRKLIEERFNTYCLGGGSESIVKYKRTYAKNGLVNFYIGKKIQDLRIYNEVINKWESVTSIKFSKNILLRYRNIKKSFEL